MLLVLAAGLVVILALLAIMLHKIESIAVAVRPAAPKLAEPVLKETEPAGAQTDPMVSFPPRPLPAEALFEPIQPEPVDPPRSKPGSPEDEDVTLE